MNDPISINVANHIADIRFNRPDKLNALNRDVMDALIDAAARVKSQTGIRCVLLSGEGRGFCAGLDRAGFQDMDGGSFTDIRKRTHGIANFFQQVVWGWRDCPVPVIAALQGVALGGGFQIALGADIRIAHPDTKMSIMEMKWGLIPDMAGTALMCHLASEDIVRELTYTARIFSGEEAGRYGFVSHISDDPYACAMELATEIASKNPDAIRAAKALLNKVADDRAAELLLNESVLQSDILMQPNQIEAVQATLEKRPAKFRNGR